MKTIASLILALLLGTAVLAQTRTELQVSELQKPIVEYINRNFHGYTIDKIFKVDNKGEITYDICVNKSSEHEKLFFDRDGKFLRKESCTLDCCQPPKKR